MATIGSGGGDSNPYARLGLAPGASMADVKRAYRRLAKHFHPDHAGPGSLRTFMAVKTAYEWIVAHAPPMAPPPSPAPAVRSNWSGGRWYWEGMRAREARRSSPA